jgi:ATP phosphoribosyltransferase
METISIALQKSGRLSEEGLSLFKRCGISVRYAKHQLFIQDDQFGIDFIFTRDDDIPHLVQNGLCDLGIVGDNVLQELTDSKIQRIMPLGFGQCRLSLAHLKNESYQSIQDLQGKTIATSYPNTLQQFLAANHVDATLVTMSGSVELAPQIGLADLICDLVSSGSTLKENGLHEFMTISQSQAMLIRSGTMFSLEKQARLDRLLLRINAVLKAAQSRYIMLHIDEAKLPQLSSILPGSESPTVLALQGSPGKVAVHVVSLESVFWETIEKLKAIGASSILVLPIEKMIL